MERKGGGILHVVTIPCACRSNFGGRPAAVQRDGGQIKRSKDSGHEILIRRTAAHSGQGVSVVIRFFNSYSDEMVVGTGVV